MDVIYNEEAAPLISRPGIPTAVQDNRPPREKQLAVYIILASTLFERIAFYILAANLAFNFESAKISLGPLGPSTTSLIFSGTSYLATIIFAVISDWKLGRSKTIIVGFFIYLVGYILAASITAPIAADCIKNMSDGTGTSTMDNGEKHWCYVKIGLPLILIIIGAGAVQSNMAVFGAEQIQESKLASRYFDKYVIVINTSSIFAVLVIRAIVIGHKNIYIGPSIIAASMLFIAAVLFLLGYRYYIHVPPHDTVMANIIPVYKNAFETWWRYKRNRRAVDEGQLNSVQPDSISSIDNIGGDEESRITTYERPVQFLDFAKGSYNGKFPERMVNDVKSLRKALIVFTLLIPYWLIYQQLSSTFAIQAKYMYIKQDKGKYDTDSDNAVAYMWLGDPVTIIIGILILNIFVYKYLDARNRSLTITTKLVIGMCFASVTMNLTGTVEYYRQKGCDQNYGFNQSNLTVFYQLPQNILMGFSEIFAMVASFEYAFFAAPRSAQTLFMSLRFCSLGVSSFIAAGYMAAFAKTKSPVNGRLSMDFSCPSEPSIQWTFYTYFFVLGGVQFVFMVVLIVCQKTFRIIMLNPQQMETSQFVAQKSTSSMNLH